MRRARVSPHARGGPLPPLLATRGSDEYRMPPPGPRERWARARARERSEAHARGLAQPLRRYQRARTGTAATLRAIDAAAGGGFYEVPTEAERDPEAADAAFAAPAGEGPVIDVQTHYVAAGRTGSAGAEGVLDFIARAAPERFADLDRRTSLGLAEYLRCVFVESETAVAVLTAAPGDDAHNILPNPEIRATREILDRTAGPGRLLHHAIVHPEAPGELEALEGLLGGPRLAGFKVYTLYGSRGAPGGWRLDDPAVGLPFLERARALGVRRVCAHKGLSQLAPTGSPADVGPAARAFPDLDLLVYHAGYEVPADEASEERAFDAAAPRGSDRLVASLRGAGIAPGANVYAELGSTWAILLRRPLEAAHVLGKLLRAVGDTNVLWGTDSVWYGPAQPLIDAFRAFRIPEELQERHGYPALTPARKAAILGGNAARVYGVDPARAAALARDDELAWIPDALAEARQRGLIGD